jgi:cell division control protein 45
VSGFDDLRKENDALIQDNEELKSIVMINCGGIIDIGSFFDLDEGQTAYIIDSHRPYALANVQPDNEQVVVVALTSDDVEYPEEPEDLEEDSDLDSEIDLDSSFEDSGAFSPMHTAGADDAFGHASDSDGEAEFLNDGASVTANSNSRSKRRRLQLDDDDYGDGSGDADADDDAFATFDADEDDDGHNGFSDEKQAFGDNENHNGDDDDDDDDDDVHSTTAAGGGDGAGVLPLSPSRTGNVQSHSRPRKRRRRNNVETSLIREQQIKSINDYYRGSYYSTAASVLLYEIARMHNKSSEFLWLSILGFTDQFIHDRIAADAYDRLVSIHNRYVATEMKPSVHRSRASIAGGASSIRDNDTLEQDSFLGDSFFGDGAERKANSVFGGDGLLNPGVEPGMNDNLVNVLDNGYITSVEEYRFMLMRFWSLYDSMFHSSYVAAQLSTWRSHGQTKLNTLLAKMGIPLKECQQRYTFMNGKLKKRLKKQLNKYSSKFNLDDVTYRSFMRQHGPKLQISAADMTYAITALLEEPVSDSDSAVATALNPVATGWEANFWRAYDALSSGRESLLMRGIKTAIELQKSTVQQGTAMVTKKEVSNSGVFRHAIMNEPPALFSHPLALSKLATFTMNVVHSKNSSKSPATKRPFVLASALRSRGTYLVVGVPELEESMEKNNFGTYFAKAAEDSSARVRHDGFDTSVIEILKNDLDKFLEILSFHLYAEST